MRELPRGLLRELCRAGEFSSRAQGSVGVLSRRAERCRVNGEIAVPRWLCDLTCELFRRPFHEAQAVHARYGLPRSKVPPGNLLGKTPMYQNLG